MIFTALILIGIFLDSNFFSVPLVFILSLLYARRSIVAQDKRRKNTLDYNSHKVITTNIMLPILTGAIGCLVIDVIRMQIMGISPLIFLISVGALLVYGRFFELSRSRFFAVILTVITCIYSYVLGYSLISTILFLLILVVGKWILALLSNEKN